MKGRVHRRFIIQLNNSNCVSGESSHEWRGRTDTPLIQTANFNIYTAYLAKL